MVFFVSGYAEKPPAVRFLYVGSCRNLYHKMLTSNVVKCKINNVVWRQLCPHVGGQGQRRRPLFEGAEKKE